MENDDASLEKSTALIRRQYWQQVYEAALAANAEAAAAQALRLVQEYDAFLALLEREDGRDSDGADTPRT